MDSIGGLTGCVWMFTICTLKYQKFRRLLIRKIEPLLVWVVHDLQVLGCKVFVHNIWCHDVVAKIDGLSVAERKRPIVQGAAEWSPNATPLLGISPCVNWRILQVSRSSLYNLPMTSQHFNCSLPIHHFYETLAFSHCEIYRHVMRVVLRVSSHWPICANAAGWSVSNSFPVDIGNWECLRRTWLFSILGKCQKREMF